jgi:hypothetical protein
LAVVLEVRRLAERVGESYVGACKVVNRLHVFEVGKRLPRFMCGIIAVLMLEKFKAWAALAAVRRVPNEEVQNSIHDKLIMWGINAAGNSISRAMGLLTWFQIGNVESIIASHGLGEAEASGK